MKDDHEDKHTQSIREKIQEKNDKAEHDFPQIAKCLCEMVFHRSFIDLQPGSNLFIRKSLLTAHNKYLFPLGRHFIHRDVD